MYPERLKCESTKRTPLVVLEEGRIFFLGRSIPENPGDFYRPVHAWISEYARVYRGDTTICMGFEFINTSSTKWIYTILKELGTMRDLKLISSVFWYYEEGDDDMLDLGYIMKSLIEGNFNIIETEDLGEKHFQAIIEESIGAGSSFSADNDLPL